MKSKYFKYTIYIFLSGIIALTSCSKDDEPVTPESEQPISDINEEDGISKNDLETNKGDIGIIIDARNVAKKGYSPVTAEVKIDATQGDYSKSLVLNEFTNVASISIPIEDLSDAAVNELKEGVSVTIDIKDKEGKTIRTETFTKVSFQKNGTALKISVSTLTEKKKPLSFNSAIPYHVQVVVDGELSNLGIATVETSDGRIFPKYIKDAFNAINKIKAQYYLSPVPGKEATFYIRTVGSNHYWRTLRIQQNSTNHLVYEELDNQNLTTEEHEFIIETNDDGSVYIKNNTHGYIRRAKDAPAISGHAMTTGYEDQYYQLANLRIVPATIQWKIDSFGKTEFMKPILPSAETSFGFNSTLVNCSQGTLEQEVGAEISEESSTTIGWEESIELSSESTYEVSASVEASASAKFFGVGVDVTATASTGYSVSKGMTTSNTGFGEKSVSKTQTFFSNRTIEVLPKTGVLVYDAYQSYKNVIIPFVQRYRVRGTDTSNNETLTGNEIVSQFSFNNFDGVITTIGSDFVEITVRGTMKLDNLIETQSKVKEVTTTCD
ncbi:hypothetical protein ATO12_03045 [Aquimarina atlantica]|uniref:Uncharacterized protein n=1 Tax=Aquimarina atlantica TaxID=1317122 RepID=A0A023C1G2_9FLAO|nr:hypothetical protein [Aquimarina atlantica]EZH75778.1 hypothetical protein ATO12_03045 [Aquimarina atlantica]